MQRRYFFALSSIAILTLGACSGESVGKQLGLERNPPDEFQVLSRPPLSVPPEFNLRAPTDGSEGDGLISPASRQAEEAVFGTTNTQQHLKSGSAETAVMPVIGSDAASPTDQNFLNRAGVSAANPDIRKTLRLETGDLGFKEEKSMLEKLRDIKEGDPTIDAEKEAERIKENLETGKAINEGEVETKSSKDQSVLERLGDIF